jgi:hypothetical protein
MNTLRHDLRAALRALARQPTYAAVTILVLALAIGANTTVFSVFNGGCTPSTLNRDGAARPHFHGRGGDGR